MTDVTYKRIKHFVLNLPESKWILLDSIRSLTPDNRPVFIEACKKIMDDDDYDGKNIYISFSSDYSAIRVFEVFSKNNLINNQNGTTRT